MIFYGTQNDTSSKEPTTTTTTQNHQNPINLKTFFIFHFTVKSQQAKLFTLKSFVCENANIIYTHTHKVNDLLAT